MKTEIIKTVVRAQSRLLRFSNKIFRNACSELVGHWVHWVSDGVESWRVSVANCWEGEVRGRRRSIGLAGNFDCFRGEELARHGGVFLEHLELFGCVDNGRNVGDGLYSLHVHGTL